MRKLALPLLLCLALAVAPAPARAGTAIYRGYSAVDQVVRNRLWMPGSSFNLTRSVLPDPLFRLLGGYGTQIVGTQFEGGTPNAISLTLWTMVFQDLGIRMAVACRDATEADDYLHPEVLAHLLELCEWPKAGIDWKPRLQALWLDLMQFDAPLEEFEAWFAYLEANHKNLSGKDLIKVAVPAAYLNPFFLLQP